MIRLLFCFCLAAFAAQSTAAVLFSISPVSQNATVGTNTSVDINVAGLGNGTALGTYDIEIAFDAALLSYSATTFGDQLDLLGFGDVQSVTPGIGSVRLVELSLESVSDLNSLQKTSFKVATLTFETLAVGNSPLALTVNALGDAAGSAITADMQNGAVSISPVPEPNSLLLILLGLSALGLAMRCRNGPSSMFARAFRGDGALGQAQSETASLVLR